MIRRRQNEGSARRVAPSSRRPSRCGRCACWYALPTIANRSGMHSFYLAPQQAAHPFARQCASLGLNPLEAPDLERIRRMAPLTSATSPRTSARTVSPASPARAIDGCPGVGVPARTRQQCHWLSGSSYVA
jgi:hypothetical protein